MNRNKNEAKSGKGFYIAVCCCVLVIAAVGYVSRFAGNSEKGKGENIITENLPEISQTALREEISEPEEEITVSENTEAASGYVHAEDNTPVFKNPVSGKIVGEFSGESLIFYKELSDWRSHNGVDFNAKEGEKVLASADGVVEAVYSDNLGNCILIDHENGIKTVYANLEESDLDLSGQNVKAGDEIGTVGKSAVADLTSEAHLHFEILKDGKPTDPTEYLK